MSKENIFHFLTLWNLVVLRDSISDFIRVKSHRAELFPYPAFPMIRWTIYSIDCPLSDSLSGDQASLCSFSFLILFLLRNLFLPFASGKLNRLVWILQCYLQAGKVSPGPWGRVAARAAVRQGVAGSCGVEPPVLTGHCRQAQAGSSWQNSQPGLQKLGGKRGEAVNQHHRSASREYNLWWNPVNFKTLGWTKIGLPEAEMPSISGLCVWALGDIGRLSHLTEFQSLYLLNPNS